MCLIEFLLNINVGALPGHGYECVDQAPLPSSKALWEATTQSEWEAEYTTHLAAKKVNGILTFATLRNSQNSYNTTIEKDDLEDLGSWSSRIDELGSMFLVAAVAVK